MLAGPYLFLLFRTIDPPKAPPTLTPSQPASPATLVSVTQT